jgi:teichuronic acid biosynthesis glycosyltransferase TuaG
MFSIILPFYNAEQTLGYSVQSVIDQSFDKWELLLINDGSNDSSGSIADRFSKNDTRIRIINLNENMGVGYARNLGIELAENDLILFLDSDDLWYNIKLEFLSSYIVKHPACGVYYSSYNIISNEGVSCNKVLKIRPINCLTDYLKRTNIGLSFTLVDKSRIGKIRFSQDRTRQDTRFWIKLLQNETRFCPIQKVLGDYRLTKNSLSRNKIKAAIGVWRIYNKELGLSNLAAFYCFLHYGINSLNKYERNNSVRTVQS